MLGAHELPRSKLRGIRGEKHHLSRNRDSTPEQSSEECFDSIGYGKRGNDRVLASEASRVSKKGGYVAINITDPEYCRETLQPTAVYEYETPKGKIVDLYQRKIENNNLLKCKQTTIKDGEKF